MNNEITSAVNAVSAGNWYFVLLLIGAPLLSSYFGVMAAEAAKKRVEHEWVATIQKIVEHAKLVTDLQREQVLQFNREKLARESQIHDLRQVALEKRLAVHQECFVWVCKFQRTMDLAENAASAYTWLNQNVLYLEPDVTDNFYRAISMASLKSDLSGQHVPEHARAGAIKTLRECGQAFEKARSSILAAMRLPPLNPISKFEENEEEILKKV